MNNALYAPHRSQRGLLWVMGLLLLSISILLSASLLKSTEAAASSTMLTCNQPERLTVTKAKSNFMALNEFLWRADGVVIKVKAAHCAQTAEYLCVLQLNMFQKGQLPAHTHCSLFCPQILESHSKERHLVAMVTTVPTPTPDIWDAEWSGVSYSV